MRIAIPGLSGVYKKVRSSKRIFSRKKSRDQAQLKRSIEILSRSILFDPVWYRMKYPDVQGGSADIVRHYCLHGWREGRNPHPVFDTRYYLVENPDVIASGANPLVHFIEFGWHEKRSPHPLFDIRFYLDHNHDVLVDGLNPLEHYLQYGGKEGRDPNPYFSTGWYLSQHPGVMASKLNPLVHYITIGEADGANPSPGFEIDWYLRCNLDVARAGIGPLYHFLRGGWKEGREPSRAYGLLGPVTNADITCLKAPSVETEVALFVTHSPNGYLKPHVRHYLKSLNKHEVAPILIVAADEPFLGADADLLQDVKGLFVRQNEGFDFAAWAHVLNLHPEIYDSEILYLVNDSVIGPLSDELFNHVLRHIRASSADFFGLTDSNECCWHVQSYFLAFKRPALRSVALQKFVSDVVSFSRKTSVIAEYETRLASILIEAELTCDVVFPQSTSVALNRTLFHWKSLIESGFPFLKVSTVREGHPDVDTSDWREVLSSAGYDVSLAEPTVSEGQPSLPNDNSAPPARKHRSSAGSVGRAELDAGFDAEFYLTIYPDVAAARLNPYEHYVKFGRDEGRLSRLPTELGSLDSSESKLRKPETVLVVSHEGVRGGAPVLAYNITVRLLKRYNVIALFLSDGPILTSCRDAGALVVGPIGLMGSPELAELAIRRITEVSQIKFAVINTVESRYVLPALARRYIPAVSLIHEFAAYIRPRNAFREAAFWSGEFVFSTEITRRNAVMEYPELAARTYPIVPQGRCIVPKGESLDVRPSQNERALISRHLRPSCFPEDGVVIVGAGLVEFRKGVDLFIDCAARVLRMVPHLPCRFVWVGRGYSPETDVQYSVYLAEQVRRTGIGDHFAFVNEVADLEAVYRAADILLMSSRLDPLPNVAIDALTFALPVLCFADTTGIADILTQNGLGEHTVSRYLDTNDMAEKVVSLVRSKELRARVAAQSAEVARSTFGIERYVSEIERLADQQAAQADQERLDVETIANSDILRSDFYLPPGQQEKSQANIIRHYVRSWASGLGRRKPFPGFHPGMYREQHGLSSAYADPLAEYLRAGRPEGPWACPVIGPSGQRRSIPPEVRIGLHIHAYHLNVLPEILRRLMQNSVRPDLLVSVKSEAARLIVEAQLQGYRDGAVDVRLVPDPGRDVGPFLTEFGEVMLEKYDLIGHLHTKTSADLAESSVGRVWVKFLLENVLGNSRTPMADIILGQMAADPKIGLVFPDDPHVIGWDKNKEFVDRYRSSFCEGDFPENIHFPVGAMFWARPEALRPMFDLRLDWQDYPAEPLPYDGSLLHGLERLYGLSTARAGFSIVNTNIPGVTR